MMFGNSSVLWISALLLIKIALFSNDKIVRKHVFEIIPINSDKIILLINGLAYLIGIISLATQREMSHHF